MPTRLTTLEPPTPDCLLTGDPRRAFALAGAFMIQPKMSHQARGLWGYTGVTAAGSELTVQSTGSGAPSAVAVLGDLAGLGVERVIRLGSCVAPAGEFPLGTVLLVERAIARDGASAELARDADSITPDPGLFQMLEGIAPAVAISSHDVVARFDPLGTLPDVDAAARDMQTAAILAMALRVGIEAAAILIVAADDDGRGLEEADLTARFVELGREVLDRLEKSPD